jgi:hypothetical protein
MPVPTKGTVYLVSAVRYWTEYDVLALAFNDFPGDSFNSARFRKLVPACDRIAQQEEGLIPHEGFFEGRPDL